MGNVMKYKENWVRVAWFFLEEWERNKAVNTKTKEKEKSLNERRVQNQNSS